VSKPEMNLDVDAPDKVASVLTAAATAYQASAVELSAAWQDRQIPLIRAASPANSILPLGRSRSSSSSGSTLSTLQYGGKSSRRRAPSAAVEGARGVRSIPL